MARTSREVWAKRVERWQASDLTAKEFAVEIGVNPRTLSHWKWILGKDRESATSAKKRRRKSDRESVSFTEVIVKPSPASQAPIAIEIVVDSRRVVRVGALFDGETLERVLDVIEARS